MTDKEMRIMALHLALAEVCESGKKACDDGNNGLIIFFMKAGVAITRELAVLTGDPIWTDEADAGMAAIKKYGQYLEGKRIDPKLH